MFVLDEICGNWLFLHLDWRMFFASQHKNLRVKTNILKAVEGDGQWVHVSATHTVCLCVWQMVNGPARDSTGWHAEDTAHPNY